MERLLIIFTLALLSLETHAALYTNTDKSGNVTYSDTPENNSQPMNLPHTDAPVSFPNSSTTTPLSATPQLQIEKRPYVTFLMTDPQDQETFQNQRDIPITFKIEPALQQGDKIQLYLDGGKNGEPVDLNQAALHLVDRGEHHISAAIVDGKGVILKQTNAITIFIHYSAIPTGSGAVKTGL